MTDTFRWRPPLPSFGRKGGAPVTLVRSRGQGLLEHLQEYYTERRSVGDLFEVRTSPNMLRRIGIADATPRYLSEYPHWEQAHILLSSLWYKASDNFKLKLRLLLRKRGGLSKVRQWFHTANGMVLPYLISGGQDYQIIDRLTRFTLENCANNYAQFISDMKSLKKRMRKAFALGRSCTCPRYLRTYYAVYSDLAGDPRSTFRSPNEWGRFVLLWTQTRASGLADSKMIAKSVDKFISTVTAPCSMVPLNRSVLNDCVRGCLGVSPDHARISVGTTSCLESSRQEGGKSFHLRRLCRSNRLHTKYDFVTLEPTSLTPRPVRCSEDVVHWAVQTALERPAFVRSARLHCVAEPSKARTITIASYAYQVIMGVFAHVFQATLKSAGVRSGLTRDRHLWRFLTDTMNPQSSNWDSLRMDQPIWSLSTDLSEATDHGNPKIARQVWLAMIQFAMCHPSFPIGLAVLAMNLYCGKRYIFVPHGGKYSLVVTTRGWFMGDMMTKVILTVVHDYSMRLSGLNVYSLVGDDEVALSNERGRLVRHLHHLEQLDFKVSRDDTFISTRLMFYCEEGALVPQRPTQATHVEMRRQRELGYLDYPRIRLLLAEWVETDQYSMTNIGRFSLLGKETKWVHNTNPTAAKQFLIAGLLQHVMVPQDSDTLCPYTPLEIGGDGAYHPDPMFLHRVIEDKSRDPREVRYRIQSLLEGTTAFRFVRSDRLNEVVHKHHLLLPALEEVRKYLPPESVVVPQSDVHRTLLESVKVRGLERPQQTWLRLCRGFYYRRIFAGAEPPVPSFDIQRSFSAGSRDVHPDLGMFLTHWRNPGFRFANHDPYFVIRDRADKADPLHLPWVWSDLDTLKYPSSFSIFSQWMEQDVTLQDRALDDVIRLIVHGQPLPDRVVKRLNLFMESDNYILSQLPKSNVPESYFLVTRDLKLCAQVSRVLTTRRGRDVFVYALDPAIYLVGGLSNGCMYHSSHIPREDYAEVAWVEDPGAILHVDYTEFTDGFPHYPEILDIQYSVYRTSHQLVAVIRPGHTESNPQRL